MAIDYNIDCGLTAEIDVTQEVATSDEVIEAEIIINTDDEPETIPRIEVELNVTQWSLVSDAIFIKNITGEEPQWFKDMIDDIILENDELLAEFQDIQTYIDALEVGYTNLVSITDDHATQIASLKVASDAATAAIVRLDDVKITEQQASVISSEVITAWMRGGESAAWFKSHVQAVATDTSANTLAIIQLGAEVDGVESSVTELSEALVDKYINPEWDGTTDPDPAGEPEWLYTARAKHSLEVNANGSISGFIADAVSGPEGEISSFKIFADEFMVCDKVDDQGEPGTVAFLIKSSSIPGQPPLIMLNGDVYFGEILPETGGVPIEYKLSDITDDLVVDPVEKDALQRMLADVNARHIVIDILVIQTTGRYNLELGASDALNLYVASHDALILGLTDLEIIGSNFIPPAGYQYTPSTISSRDNFNLIVSNYDDGYNAISGAISDTVKEVADNAFDALTIIFEDGVLSADEKTQLQNWLVSEEQYYNEKAVHVPPMDCATYPNGGYEPYSRGEAVAYPYRRYHDSLLEVEGNPITKLCGAATGDTFNKNGIKTQLYLPVYDLFNPIDTIVSTHDIQAAMASLQWFNDSKTGFAEVVANSSIDTTFIKTTSSVDPGIYTLIKEDTINTNEIGEAGYYGDYSVARNISYNYIDFKTGAMHVEDANSNPVYFHINSEASGTFNAICDSTNDSNFRGELMEATKGSFGELYSGDIVVFADSGKYRTRSKSVLSTRTTVHLYDMGTATEYSGSVRFYSPTFPTNTDAVNDYRIHKIENAVFNGILSGAFMDRKSETGFTKVTLVLEYRVDDGAWADAGNQVPDTTNNQTVIFEAPMCTQYIDFRVRIFYASEHMIYTQKNVALTMMLLN